MKVRSFNEERSHFSFIIYFFFCKYWMWLMLNKFLSVMKECVGRTASQDSERSSTHDVVFPEEKAGDWWIQQEIQVSDLQDQREEGSAVHNRTFHKLCAGSSSQHRQPSPALDKERTGTSVSAGLLEKLICVIQTLVLMVVLF